MRRNWNYGFLAARGARWLLAVLVILPAGLALALVLGFIWLLWLAAGRLQLALHVLLSPEARLIASWSGATVRHGPGGTRILDLSAPPNVPLGRLSLQQSGTCRPTSEDLERSLAGMARHGWPKPKVMQALKAAGATRVWSERDGATEHVHLLYRAGERLLDRYTRPAASIDLYFDAAGSLFKGRLCNRRKI